MPPTVLLGALLLSGGAVAVLTAFKARSRRVALLNDCVKVTGRVVRLDDTTSDGDVSCTWAPVVEYAVAGASYELVLLPRFDTATHRVGKRVPVFCHRPDPAHAVKTRRTWDVSLLCAAAAFLPVLLGAALFCGQAVETARPAAAPSASAPRP